MGQPTDTIDAMPQMFYRARERAAMLPKLPDLNHAAKMLAAMRLPELLAFKHIASMQAGVKSLKTPAFEPASKVIEAAIPKVPRIGR